MTNPKPFVSDGDIHTVYNAVVHYHNNLVNMRFTIAALYLTGSTFLAKVLFSDVRSSKGELAVPVFGLIITFVFWIIEHRTQHLLRNLGERGKKLEYRFKLREMRGFFALMEKQPLEIEVPFPFMKKYNWYKNLFTHSVGLKFIYFIGYLFWIVMLLWREIKLIFMA